MSPKFRERIIHNIVDSLIHNELKTAFFRKTPEGLAAEIYEGMVRVMQFEQPIPEETIPLRDELIQFILWYERDHLSNELKIAVIDEYLNSKKRKKL